jgi:hypothetical protein
MEEKLWEIHHPNEPMPGSGANNDEDDDVIMEGTGRDLSRNARCPISGTEVSKTGMMHAAIDMVVPVRLSHLA